MEIRLKEGAQLEAQTLNRLCRLPVFNQAAVKLLTVATDAESARKEFESAFRSDPSLATDLLLLANSVEFGFRTEVYSIPHALSMLGLERARSLAFVIATNSIRRYGQVDVSTTWKHSIASAALAEHLARVYSLSLPILHTAALLHDIGSLGLQLTAREQYSSLVEFRIADIDQALTVEKELFGMNHCKAGGALARIWGFPEALQHHIHVHHDHTPLAQDPVANLVQTACRLAEALGYPESGITSGTSSLVLEDIRPAQFRRHAECTRERMAAVVDAQLAATTGL